MSSRRPRRCRSLPHQSALRARSDALRRQSGQPAAHRRHRGRADPGGGAGRIPDLVEQLNRRYVANRCPYEIVSEGPGYRLTIRRDHAWLRNQFYGRVREARLSRAAIETLAIVAYRQPITGDDVSTAKGTRAARSWPSWSAAACCRRAAAG